MENRFVRRLANKHLDIDSDAGFEIVLNWLKSEQLRFVEAGEAASAGEPGAQNVVLNGVPMLDAAPPEVRSFIDGFNEFLRNLGKSFFEFERVIAARELSAQVIESELSSKNAELESIDRDRNGVILRLLGVVNELSSGANGAVAETQAKTQTTTRSSREQVENLVTTVEKLAKEHRSLLELMEQLFQYSVAIAATKTQDELEKVVRKALGELTNCQEKIHLYFARQTTEGTRYGRPPNAAAKQTLLDLESIENVFTGRLVPLPRDAQANPKIILVIAGDPEKYRVGGVHFHSLNALVPSILSALEIIEYVSDERRKVEMKSDLLMASLVQRTLMPSHDPVGPPKIQILGRSFSASECGGDWWNFYQMKDGRTLIFVGDVTGHGTASALVTAAVKGFCDSLKYRSDFDLLTMMKEINDLLADFHASCGRAMTLAAVVLDPEPRQIEYCLAAHPHPFIMREAAVEATMTTSEGFKPSMLAGKGSLLGMSNDVHFSVQKLSYEPGDFLVLYTDGITEATNPRSQAFGERRLFKFVKDGLNKRMAIPELLDHLSIELYRFTEEETLNDDVTLVVAKLS